MGLDERIPTQHLHSYEGHNNIIEGQSIGKKRKFSEAEIDSPLDMGQKLSHILNPELPACNLTPAKLAAQEPQPKVDDDTNPYEWQKVERGTSAKKQKRQPKPENANYPTITFSNDARLQSTVKISDLQNLVLYLLADGPTVQFVAVKHRPQIRKVVVLMVPGLEESMFFSRKRKITHNTKTSSVLLHQIECSPDDYYPNKLHAESLPSALKPFADIFSHIWPIKTPGDDRMHKMHSPLHAMLSVPIHQSKKDKKAKGVQTAQEPQGWKNKRTPITEFIQTAEDLLENNYTIHPACYSTDIEKEFILKKRVSDGTTNEQGWMDSAVEQYDEGTVPHNEIESGSITAGREVLAIDCEMCMTGEEEFSLARISIIDWSGSVILDELVKPDKPITDYVTMYSGITEEMLAPVTTTLKDIQKTLLTILHPRTILIGHSLNADLTCMKLTHPFIIDTALAYPHPRGPPLKSSLKYLAQRYLGKDIQKGGGQVGKGAGHDSIEDAKTCLDLMKLKCEKGAEWGATDVQRENIFKRVAQKGIRYKNYGGSVLADDLPGRSSAAVDWGDPGKGPGGGATFAIGCQSDQGVVEGVLRAIKGDPDGKEIPGGGVDFVWGRLRELEDLKGWNNVRLPTKATLGSDIALTDAIAIAEPAVAVADAIAINEVEGSNEIEHASAAQTPIDPATATLTDRVRQIYEDLPPCTAFIVYSGSGDPREMSRLQALQTQFKREYKIKKWDELTVKWTDVEEQALRKALVVARSGIGFITVK